MRDRGPVVKHRSHNKLTGNTKIWYTTPFSSRVIDASLGLLGAAIAGVVALIGLPLATLFKTYEPSIKANDPRYAYHPDYKKSWKKLYNKIFGDR